MDALPILVALAVLVAAGFVIGPILRSRRRLRVAQEQFPAEWLSWLAARLPIHRRIPAQLRRRLEGLIVNFVREKSFVGCNGLTVTDEMRVVIAGYACLLVMNRPDVPRRHFYDELMSILVYPTAFVVPETHHDEDGVVTESESVLSGQAWDARRIILSWQDVAEATHAEHNVVLHEFAHYLDMEDETMDGAPGLGSAQAYEQWSEVFWGEYDKFCDEVDAGRDTFLDPYAATEPAEFFAVVTEAFFQQPAELRSEHAVIYEQLRRYYRVDPATW